MNHPQQLALLLALAFPTAVAAGQTAPDTGAALRVAVAKAPIQFDGRLVGPDWAAADSITDFRQREPIVGAPASQRTVVKAIRDADALYVGVRAYDTDARDVRARQLRRDADLSSDDNLQLLIDTFHDRRGAFVFGTNPNGARWDAQLVDVDNLNEDWNGVWDVAVSRDSAGWTDFRGVWREIGAAHLPNGSRTDSWPGTRTGSSGIWCRTIPAQQSPKRLKLGAREALQVEDERPRPTGEETMARIVELLPRVIWMLPADTREELIRRLTEQRTIEVLVSGQEVKGGGRGNGDEAQFMSEPLVRFTSPSHHRENNHPLRTGA